MKIQTIAYLKIRIKKERESAMRERYKLNQEGRSVKDAQRRIVLLSEIMKDINNKILLENTKEHIEEILKYVREKLRRQRRIIELKNNINRIRSKAFKKEEINKEILQIGEVLKDMKNE